MPFKYLVVKCYELHDQWECDADRIPVCMTNDWRKWRREICEINCDFVEVYEVHSDGDLYLCHSFPVDWQGL